MSESGVDILGLAEHLCRMVVKDPKGVSVEKKGGSRNIIITANVADDDIGRVIGKQGATIKAIRYFLEQAGKKKQFKVFFELANREANWAGREEASDSDSGDADETKSDCLETDGSLSDVDDR